MSVKLFAQLFSLCPFIIINLCLFLQINILVQCIVIKFRIFNFVLSWLMLICKEEIVHNFNCEHNLVLSEDVLNNDKRDVVLELLNDLLELLFWNAFAQEINHKHVISVVLFFLELSSEVLQQPNNLFKKRKEVKVLHLWKHQEHEQTTYRCFDEVSISRICMNHMLNQFVKVCNNLMKTLFISFQVFGYSLKEFFQTCEVNSALKIRVNI